ncbi:MULTISPECIES: hypothetical protein [Rhodococcus]|uniref:hypothetical protein n=1 Tax=Rhodococcus TaxID=1827 RepID=UPI000F74376A|nr:MULTISPECIES: hypothetical protein [Rhodococcus]
MTSPKPVSCPPAKPSLRGSLPATYSNVPATAMLLGPNATISVSHATAQIEHCLLCRTDLHLEKQFHKNILSIRNDSL